MKQLLPHNVLLVLALAVTGLMVLYNLSLREWFAVVVAYDLPDPGVVETMQQAQLPVYSEEMAQEPAEYVHDDYYAEPSTVVLVTFPLELNSATLSELMYVPKIGSVTAQRIVQYRDVLGGYTELDQLKEISGIGDKTFADISPYLYLEGEWAPNGEDEGEE